MALSLAQNAIALLIDLSERGEIDPWDVKVIDVIDRFLSQLKPLQAVEAGRAPYEADLSESGQAFLYASMLVLLKADTLARTTQDEAPLEDEFLEESDGTAGAPLPLSLERRLRRRAVARPMQSRQVTLQELISQLEMMAAAVSDPRPRQRVRRPRPQSRSQAVRVITQLAHQENLSEIAAALEQFLQEHWDAMSQGDEWMEFEQLLELWVASDAAAETRQEGHHATPQGDRVGVFWALLYLSAQSKVELLQEEFYQDLRVRSLAGSETDSLENSAVSNLLD
ncbi:segregation/condensation protein A [Thermoleptolyngbya sp. C42_A2020_037]|uniref:segregation/condensation protein A n=1 Tax=Thermoleptolyngbya sp. C42_A2020_037 TaxID=2747799 RepID=UPI0019E8329F|nr:segregation/condensation protein A [Thermoleptolyngbya sp. C42_A2020_037]MBF2085544.1 segregation/condensation protein A [Thermoleptolyngbya sp. C42_A2020_037]